MALSSPPRTSFALLASLSARKWWALTTGLSFQLALAGCGDPDGGVETLGPVDSSSSNGSTGSAATGGTSPGAGDSAGSRELGECAAKPNGTLCDQGRSVCNNAQCVAMRCGDGIVSGINSEQCDDGNTIDGDGCSSSCKIEAACGNGRVEAGEACDAGAANGQPGSACGANCQPVAVAVCGNGKLEAGEQCDDGNRLGRDGCSTLCTLERCGNKIVDAMEQCDDGNLADGDGCSWMCTVERCGDGIFHPSLGEQCDDGNLNPDDGCDDQCKLKTFCGNRVVEAPHETCDDGNQKDGDGCSSSCKLEAGYCGDGIAQVSEQCDDGNLVAGDGCSEYCQLEKENTAACKPVDSEKLPARARVLTRAPAAAQFVYTSELFGRYRALCGGCHVDGSQGDFQTKAGTMVQVAAEFEGHREKILDTMTTSDPTKIMPPKAKPLSQLGEAAPAVVLASQLEAWYDQGLSPDGFYWQGAPVQEHEGFRVDEALSKKLTNIGSCEPERDLLHSNQYRSQKMDAFFAKAKEWPEYLSDTDFVSMDSKELARGGVVSYATTYELWADNAKKMRHFKLPYGKKIRFNKEKQLFELPENTRVYKTFLKEVKDSAGKISYRKMETRVILVRRDEIAEDGSAKVRALYGSYRWNEEETQAVLVATPLRNGKPFADDIFVYDADELEAAKIRRDTGAAESISQALFQNGSVRHYVIPGSARCDECHLGSLEENFVVGFSPLQLHRRQEGKGGILDKPYPSELNQLRRFIDWGLFENFENVNDIRLLEAKQSPSFWSGRNALSPAQAKANALENKLNPDAKPKPVTPKLSESRAHRNQSELEMQGYMLGNCAHCHNPRGYPSVREPELAQRLNMHPLTDGGGIFQFRLDNMSPRNERGGDRRIPVPYISPSTHDVYDPESKSQSVINAGFNKAGPDDKNPAPWRSLIYRNVDTPYTYVFHRTIFPHMPVHTPGYDCRIRDLSAKWMLSIPSKLKNPLLPDPFPKDNDEFKKIVKSLNPDAEEPSDPEISELRLAAALDPQPWTEVYQGERGYATAVDAAQKRVQDFLGGGRSTGVCQERVGKYNILSSNVFTGLRSEPDQLATGLIVEPHLGAYDMTEPSGPWWPRRADWKTALVDRKVDCVERPYNDLKGKGVKDKEGKFRPYCTVAQLEEATLVESVLEGMTLDDGIKSLALESVPLGLWEKKPECSFDGIPTVSSIPKGERWEWMKSLKGEDLKRPVYFEAAGATLFKSVCAQCHGRKGDSKGAMANTLNELTGGESIVANFDTGMFGPVDKRGDAIKRRFGGAKGSGTAEDVAAQYMAWMSLGGTRSRIHSAILNIVNSAGILGKPRPAVGAASDANMLNVAKEICGAFVNYKASKPIGLNLMTMELPILSPSDHQLAKMPVIKSLADAQIWYRICTYKNPMPIMIVASQGTNATPARWTTLGVEVPLAGPGRLITSQGSLVKREYGMGEPMLTHDGLGVGARVETMTDATVFPMCVRRPPAEAFDKVQGWMSNAVVGGKQVPYCPESWDKWNFAEYSVTNHNAAEIIPQMMTRKEVREWVMRGAANAGFMVFAFTQELIAGRASLQVDYNRCEELPAKGDKGSKPSGEGASSIAR